jgi:DMSO/TMAO reductase YedYZ molybdopterin-dependent catalytic subunit
VDYLNAHPDVAIHGVPYIDSSTYRLKISGMVNNPQNLTYDEVVNNFTSIKQVATLPCVEGWSVTLLWEGTAITDLLNYTDASPDADTVIFLAADGYSSSLPLEYIRNNNIMIAYKMNDVTLTPKLGWPFFLVATNQYGYKWVEWITEINVSNDTNYLGYWESRGYPNNATVPGVTGASINIDENIAMRLATTCLTVSLATAVAMFYVRHKKYRRKYSHSISC